MDIVFDIDGTLADASHRLHFIKDTTYFKPGGITRSLKPNWETFLSDEQVAKDTPIEQTWTIMASLLSDLHRVIFITGRSDKTRAMTEEWLEMPIMRSETIRMLRSNQNLWGKPLPIYMRKEGDRRESHVVKRELLQLARQDGYDPKLVFEDRRTEARMWREEGLLCCNVAEGDY